MTSRMLAPFVKRAEAASASRKLLYLFADETLSWTSRNLSKKTFASKPAACRGASN